MHAMNSWWIVVRFYQIRIAINIVPHGVNASDALGIEALASMTLYIAQIG